MIVTSRPSLRTQTHLSREDTSSVLRVGDTTIDVVRVPLFEERCGVGVEEAGEPSQGVGGAVGAMVVVPARHFALVLVATHVRGDAYDGLMDVAVAETATSVTRAVLDGVIGSQFEAFVTECWLTDRGRFVWVVEGDPIFVGRALSSSDDRHSSL